MSKENTKMAEINKLLDAEFKLLSDNGQKAYSRQLKLDDLRTIINDIDSLIKALYQLDYKEAGKRCRKQYIPLLNIAIEKEKTNLQQQANYLGKLENAVRMSAKTNFEDFVRYYEWDEREKFFEPRYSILSAYAYYLNRMVFDPNFNLLIVNLPSGTGKTYLEKLHEAFSFGVDPTGTCLYLCSNDDVVKGGSRTVLEIIKSERFGEVFPELKYDKSDRTYFLKETESEWKLKDCKLMASYYAKTTQSNVVGCRASKTIHIDDLYADYKEALDENLNNYFYNKYVTVWKKRYIQNKTPKIIITGTMWSPTDFIVKVIDQTKREEQFMPSDKFKYVSVNGQQNKETKAIIQIPAMDYDTGESTCPNIWKTEDLEKEKATMDTYLWETNFQQKPTSPEGLEFDWNNLKLYEKMPENIYDGAISVIDGTRKSGKDFFSMPIFVPYDEDFAFIDCIFTKIASTELVPDIVDKILEYNIKVLIIETNVDGGLKKLILDEFDKRGVACYCDIREKYSTMQKSVRIELNKGIIKRRIWFPDKKLFGKTSHVGRFMNNFTLYNSQGGNKNDDAPDSSALFCSEFIGEKYKNKKVKAIKRPF